MVVYLTCTKGRGLHKKHIDVCRKCHENTTCEAFRKFCDKSPAAEKSPETRTIDKPAYAIALSHIITELMEIELLLGYSSEKKRKIVIGTQKNPFLKNVTIEKIKQTLKEIRSYY
jgi:hypothetical protein